MANINTLKAAVMLAGAAGVTPFIWGHRGLGKSSMIRQLCEENNMGFIDFRASQVEASDLRGLPDRVDGRTVYLPPADMPIGDLTIEEITKRVGTRPTYSGVTPTAADLEAVRKYNLTRTALQPHYQRGILFLDELNRAQDDVLQSAFQLVLDRRTGQYVLPPGWFVVAAGNYNEGYVTNGFTDPAFLNRFTHLTLSDGESTLEEWVQYMALMHGGAASDVIEFASHNIKHLDGDLKGELGFTIQPSRRSWDAVVRVEQACQQGKFNDSARAEVIAGLVGREMGLAYSRYSCPVKPKDVLTQGIDPLRKKLSGLTRNQFIGLMWGLVSFCRDKVNTEEKMAETCLDFAQFMLEDGKDRDVVVAFCRTLVVGDESDERDATIRAAMLVNTVIAQLVTKRQPNQKSFIHRLVARPALQDLIKNAAWGTFPEAVTTAAADAKKSKK
jgi:hypothetical protein